MVVCPKNILSFLILLFLSGSVLSQDYQLKGKILDSLSREPLAFVNILANNGPSGASTDIDGKFILKSKEPIRFIRISYVGYESITFKPDPLQKEQLIRLRKKEVELAEVVIKPGINPAHRIIRQVLENRFINDHERMESFSYTTYEKMTFGPDTDSIPWSDTYASDSVAMQMKEFFDRQHLFLMESVTERKFMYPDKNYNNVIASRVSGFGDPLFVFLMSQVQSTTFYRDIIKIADKEYINPISFGTFNKYYFEIQDTLIEPHPYDTTFIISFRPLLNTNFEGLKGVISISTNNFAIRNVIAQPANVSGSMTIKIQQLYDFVQNEHWFPVQLNTDIIFMKAIGKGGVALTVGPASSDSSRQDLVGRGKSYISQISLNPKFKRNNFGFVEVDVDPNAYKKPEALWNQFRVDTLSLKDRNTYQIIDSIGKAQHFDSYGYKLDALINGKVPIGMIDLELDKILRINRHEGLRLGAGIHTNDKLSRYFQLGGYGAYGFRDHELKYGGKASIVVDRFRDSRLSFTFYKDLDEAGMNDPFMTTRNLLDMSQLRQMLVRRMDRIDYQEISFGGRIMKFAKVDVAFARSFVEPKYDYRYIFKQQGDIEVSVNTFRFAEASMRVRYAYGEKFLKNSRTIVSLGTSYPILWVYLGRGLTGVGGGQYEYTRVMLKLQKTLTFKYLGKSSITLMGGIVDRDIPYCNLFNGLSDYSRVSFYSPNSFATMRMNEFVADRYAALFLSHNFGQLLYKARNFQPEPELLTNFGIGSITHPENHLGIDIKGYDKVYIESGFLVNNILSMGFMHIGLGTFYRYVYYTFPDWKDNFTFKLSLTLVSF